MQTQAVTNVKETVMRDFLLADDCALNAGSWPEMQVVMDKFSITYNTFGPAISTKKTKVMHQTAPISLMLNTPSQ